MSVTKTEESAVGLKLLPKNAFGFIGRLLLDRPLPLYLFSTVSTG
ncbi:MAG: hypothetical protein ACBZ72_04060 [Candidatus Bathyarchaeia archaeon]